MGTGERRISATVPVNVGDQRCKGPSGDDDQSMAAMRVAASPPPARNAANSRFSRIYIVYVRALGVPDPLASVPWDASVKNVTWDAASCFLAQAIRIAKNVPPDRFLDYESSRIFVPTSGLFRGRSNETLLLLSVGVQTRRHLKIKKNRDTLFMLQEFTKTVLVIVASLFRILINPPAAAFIVLSLVRTRR